MCLYKLSIYGIILIQQGEKKDNPGVLKKYERKIARLQRSLAKKEKGKLEDILLG